MTSMASESVATIRVTCKQTRFHIDASPNFRELDIEGLNITLVPTPDQESASTGTSNIGGTSKARGKAKARAEGVEILSDTTLRLKAGQRYALVGRNGSGKSTLLKAIAEKLIPKIPEATRISILQQTDRDESSEQQQSSAKREEGPSVIEDVVEKATSRSELEQEIAMLSGGINESGNKDGEGLGAVRALRKVRHEKLQKRLFVLDKDARLRSGARGLQARKALTAFEKTVAESETLINQTDDEISAEAQQAETQQAIDMLAELQLQVEPSRLADIESRAKKILTGLGFTDATMDKPIASLSGGWRMRASLARCLLQETDILILDEPTNFLDLLGIVWLQRFLTSSLGEPNPTLILVSHDRDFISLCTDVLILKDKGLVYHHGDLASYESGQAERRLWLTRMKEAKDKQKAHIQETISRNLREGKKNNDDTRVRQAKSRQKKLDDRWGMEVNEKGGRFKLNRDMVGWHDSARAEINVPQQEKGVTISLPQPMDLRFPGSLLSLEGCSFRYSARAPFVLQDVTLNVGMGDRVAVIGLNGAGKSTLVRLLVDAAKPTSGTSTTHPRLRLGYYSQHAVDALQQLGKQEPALTALALLSREIASDSSTSMSEGELRAMLASLGLPGRLASDVPVRKLSGGQLVRCELARLLWRRPHCLVLDEVTTHLDYETVTALRESLRDWEGAVVLVSHDRWFVRGAIEGVILDDGEEDSSDGAGDEDDREDGRPARRRSVYRLKAGGLHLLSGGVQEFENLMEKRVKKLLGDG